MQHRLIQIYRHLATGLAALLAACMSISAIADSAWQTIVPGGDTSCSDGSAYRFFVRPGNSPASTKSQKVLLFLQGGGACWNRQTCDPAMQPSYTRFIPEDFQPEPFGAFNFQQPQNPFREYTTVYASYCSGDVHLGNRDAVYPAVNDGQQPLTIRHHGYRNMQAVLHWLYNNVPHAEDIFVAGSSAGAIASPYYAALVADHYPEAKVTQLGDGAGGYRQLVPGIQPHEQWGSFSFLSGTPAFAALQPTTFNFEQLYIAAANAHPAIQFSQYDTAEDQVQKQFLAMAGSPVKSLQPGLQANHADILARADNFNWFVAGGTMHTLLRRPEFYAFGARGVSFVDWLSQLAQGKEVSNVDCQQCQQNTYGGAAFTGPWAELWQSWEDRQQQYVAPFQIFDNVYYVGIKWVSAYIIQTSKGLILVDSLYGSWVEPLLHNIRQLGLDPADIKYVINTHGHFDHAGGAAVLQHRFGARVVMTAEDWALAAQPPERPQYYMPMPQQRPGHDLVVADGDVIELGDTRIELFQTPGHTTGVLSLRYQVRDGEQRHTAMTLGGVGLNFTGVERTKTYISSYQRLQSMQDGIEVSLPNHPDMGDVLLRAQRLSKRSAGEPHPFVDAEAYKARLRTSVANARAKLAQEQAGKTTDTLKALTNAIGQDN